MEEIVNISDLKSLNNKNLTILLVDDNPDDRILAIREIKKQFPNAKFKEVTNKSQLKKELDIGDFNLVITDYRLSFTNGLEILKEIKSEYPHIPIIMFTGTGTEEIAIEAMKNGLNDYILKSPQHFIRLSASVNSIVEQMKDKEKAEKEIQKTKLEYKTIFENTGTSTLIFDNNYNITLINNKFEKSFGYNKKEVEYNKKITDLVIKDDIDKIKNNLEEIRRNPNISSSNLQIRLINKFGNVRYTLFNIAGIPESSRCIASILDITKYKKTIEALTSIEEIFRKIFDNSELGILILSPTGKILEANDSFLDLIGYNETELLSMNHSDLIYDRNMSENFYEKIKSQDTKVVRDNIKHKTKSGEIIENRIIASTVKNYSNKIEYILIQVI